MIDKYYCLNLVETQNRHEHCKKQFKNLNLDVDFWYTTRRPIMQKIGTQLYGIQTDAYKRLQESNPFTFGAVFSCVFEHYNIIKQAYLRGFHNIVIFEDDIIFRVDSDQWKFCIDHMPIDYNICKFHYTGENVPAFNYQDNIFVQNEERVYSTLAYAISRKGMRAYIYAFENLEIKCADMMFYYVPNKYVNTVKICEPAGFKSAINNRM